ncbi:MAG TPA: hypothetical protein VFO36_08255, partial [Nitrospiraceae bacterium]|nr:hypothetical protein [Nitrospiraceae bacterium]
MQPFWRTEPLSEHETELYRLTLDAHAKSVLRDNISSNVVLNVAMGSGQMTNAIAAAIMSIGGVHAPLAATISALTTDASTEAWQAAIADGMRVPGWGNSFCKVDALWTDVEAFQREHWPSLWKRTDRLTTLL